MRIGTELMTLDEATRRAEVFIASGMFVNLKEVAQGIVIIMAGDELGIPPIASLKGMEMIQGQIVIKAHLMAALVKDSPKYDYKVLSSTTEECTIEYWHCATGEYVAYAMGYYSFTMDDAKKQQLASKKNWRDMPKIMLYNRCQSNGIRTYCPDVLLGPCYIEEEIEEKPVDTRSQAPDVVRLQKIIAGTDVMTLEPGSISDDTVASSKNQPTVEDTWEPIVPAKPELTTKETGSLTPVAESISNLFGDRGEPWEPPTDTTWRSKDTHEVPVPMEDLATPKQIGYLCSLLKDRGVADGDKKALIATVMGDDVTKAMATAAIDALKEINGLPVVWINPYVRKLREIHGVSMDTILKHLSVTYDTDKIAGLTRLQQSEIINWLKKTPVLEIEVLSGELTPLNRDWLAFIEVTHNITGKEIELIEEWMMANHNHEEADYTEIIDAPREVLEHFRVVGSLGIFKMIERSEQAEAEERDIIEELNY